MHRHVWAERGYSLLLLLVGALLGKGLDYWFAFGLVATDARGYLVSYTEWKEDLELEICFVNAGNRQCAITEVDVAFPNDQGGTRTYVGPAWKAITVTGIPTVLNAGDIRMVTIKGVLPVDIINFSAKPLDPKQDGSEAADPDTRKYELALRVRAIDFRGQRHEIYWPLFKVYVRKDGSKIYNQLPSGREVRVLSPQTRSLDWLWTRIPEAIRNRPPPSEAKSNATPTALPLPTQSR